MRFDNHFGRACFVVYTRLNSSLPPRSRGLEASFTSDKTLPWAVLNSSTASSAQSAASARPPSPAERQTSFGERQASFGERQASLSSDASVDVVGTRGIRGIGDDSKDTSNTPSTPTPTHAPTNIVHDLPHFATPLQRQRSTSNLKVEIDKGRSLSPAVSTPSPLRRSNSKIKTITTVAKVSERLKETATEKPKCRGLIRSILAAGVVAQAEKRQVEDERIDDILNEDILKEQVMPLQPWHRHTIKWQGGREEEVAARAKEPCSVSEWSRLMLCRP